MSRAVVGAMHHTADATDSGVVTFTVKSALLHLPGEFDQHVYNSE